MAAEIFISALERFRRVP